MYIICLVYICIIIIKIKIMKTDTITTEQLAKVLFGAKVKVGCKIDKHYFGDEDYPYECEELECVVLESPNEQGLIADDIYSYNYGDQRINAFIIKKGKEEIIVKLTKSQKNLVEIYLEILKQEINESVAELVSDRQYEFKRGSMVPNDEDNITSIYESI